MEIRLAEYSDRQAILDFINTNWKKNHIFIAWPELFDNYHRDGERINYMIAVDGIDSRVYGVCGFIYANHNIKPDIWLALWKVIPSGLPSLGMDIVTHIKKELNCNVLACCGIKKTVKKLYEFMGYKTGTMKHFYRLNRNISEFNIADIRENKVPEILQSGKGRLVKINSEEDFERFIDYDRQVYNNAVPYKDKSYIFKKYFHNIAYAYNLYAIDCGEKYIDAFLVIKMVSVNNARVLRIVDFYGNEDKLGECGYEFDKLLSDKNCEYIDIYEYGLSDNIFWDIGWNKHEENDLNIIPNYFEPFERTNVDIHFFTSQLDGFRMFKADGDQERPNMIYESRIKNE